LFMRLENHWQVLAWSLALTGLAVLGLQVHLLVNYEPDLRAVVRARATIATVCIAFPLALSIISLAARNARLSRQLQRLVDQDPLTGLATRTLFFARMEDQANLPGFILMVDIDFFKLVNDTYGHLAGDAVITRVAAVLLENTREADVVCRFGGEEFVVFLAEQKAGAAFDTAERIRTAIAQVEVPYDGEDLQVTVSIGGAEKTLAGDVDQVIKEADIGLYRAKASGRNCTIFADDAASAMARTGW